MALVKRISRLFAADMHAVLDQIEDPETVLKQGIREMEEEVARQIQRRKWLAAEIESRDKQSAVYARTLGELDTQLDLCFENDNEALARKLVRRKLESKTQAARLQDQRVELEDRLAAQDELIAVNREQLDGMRQKAAVFVTESSSDAEDSPFIVGGIDEDEVEIAYLREKQARTGR